MPITPIIDSSWYVRPPGIAKRLAAGGVVVRRENGRVMVAFARDKEFAPYVLPKGGVEAGEKLETAAAREVAEETGITELRSLGSLGTTERLNWDKDRWVTTHFYLFETSQVEGIPTDHAKHEGVWWFPLDALPDMLWPEQRALLEKNRVAIAWAMQ